ncbi:hypothetical protein ANN_17913 [Periplaneta americana]|uniref:Uncharacterized protein n=1 Tax=Periplaneta americana TaxID=6978 RepID=A0ABQ8SMU4_PERAM|nr:hypothetical protein ANN_17913 [Periplaneta americana]
MSSRSSTESYPAFSQIGLRENPGKSLNQVICPDQDSNPGHLVSRPNALTIGSHQEDYQRSLLRRRRYSADINGTEEYWMHLSAVGLRLRVAPVGDFSKTFNVFHQCEFYGYLHNLIEVEAFNIWDEHWLHRQEKQSKTNISVTAETHYYYYYYYYYYDGITAQSRALASSIFFLQLSLSCANLLQAVVPR